MLLFLFVMAQVQAWAMDGKAADSPGKWSQAAAMPAFWIGAVLLVACVAAFFIIGKEKKVNHMNN